MIPIGETCDGRADMTNFEMDLLDTRMCSYKNQQEEREAAKCCRRGPCRPACLPISLIAVFVVVAVFMPLLNEDTFESLSRVERSGLCLEMCRMQIAESIPTNVTFRNSTLQPSTFITWKRLLRSANRSIDIAALYWSLRDPQRRPTSTQAPFSVRITHRFQGAEIFDELVAAAQRGVKIRIAQNIASRDFPQNDSAFLRDRGYAEVRSVNISALLGSGVLHTKFLIIDTRSLYIGSANMDWRSLTEVKELGVTLWDCGCVASDLNKVFNVYWRLGEPDARLPRKWPMQWRSAFNARRPLSIVLNGVPSRLFISSAPAPLNPRGRENDMDAITDMIENATRFVHVAVMDYIPATTFMGEKNRYWAHIDDALRSAAYRGVHVRLLISQWEHSDPAMVAFLRSLVQINPGLPTRSGVQGRIDVKLFTVPPNGIPFARVNHNKYMVTDKCSFIGTSNWSGDYFLSTAGIGLNLCIDKNTTIVSEFNNIFVRDWNSAYAKDLPLLI